MNLLAVNWQDLRNPHAGGAEIHLFELLGALARQGHRIRLVCSGFPGGAAIENVAGVEVHRHGGRHSFALLGRAAVRRALREEPADVVIDDINKLPLCVASLTDRPVYAIVPHLFGTTAFQEVSWPMAALVWAAEKLIPPCYRGAWFHAISESTRDDLVARGIAHERIVVVHPGVDSEHYRPDPDGRRLDPPTFVYLGRLKRYKGVEHLLTAMKRLGRTHPEARLVVAGNGDDRPRLEGIVRSLGLDDSVTFAGYVDEEEKLRLLRGAVANVFPSPKEGWGITVMEAAACGTPSLASDAPGLRDSVIHGTTGLLVPHGEPAALAAAMEQLIDQPELVARLGAAARQHALTHTWPAAAARVEAHLGDLVAGIPIGDGSDT